jgi:ABC-type glycerol-3-phosphate transport system permease component
VLGALIMFGVLAFAIWILLIYICMIPKSLEEYAWVENFALVRNGVFVMDLKFHYKEFAY